MIKRSKKCDKVNKRVIGEDYIVKPFEILELIARVNIVLRRNTKQASEVVIGDTTVQLDSKIVTYKGEIVDLKPQEYALLEVLVYNRNLALSREKLLLLRHIKDF